ncbi:MAG: ChbG/HpnK family deacetylase [Pseudomonadota bacterium]
MIRLVVNAEEFGATPAADDGILKAHHDGIVTSTALAGNAADPVAARTALANAPALGVGLSLALIGGHPVASAGDVGTLLASDGALRRGAADFSFDWFKQAIAPAHVERELEAQIARALDAGLALDHLCSRGHLAFLPGVGEIVERLARRHHIAGIRTTVDPPTLGWITDPVRGVRNGVLAGLSWFTRRRLGALRHGPRTWGYFESGHLDEVRILEIVGRLGPGAHELVCHPAGDELRALMSTKVRTAIERRGILLSRWRDLF